MRCRRLLSHTYSRTLGLGVHVGVGVHVPIEKQVVWSVLIIIHAETDRLTDRRSAYRVITPDFSPL